MSGGITSTGFNLPTQEEIEDELRTQQLANISSSLDLSPENPMGQIVSIFARQIVSLWEGLATAYGAVDPNQAEGVLLDNVCALLGVVREAATKSTVVGTLNLNSTVTVPAGSQVSVSGQPQYQFSLKTDVVSTTSGNYTGIFQCTQTGPIPANSGTMTVIVTPVTGWNSITNANDAVLGTNVETDAALRLRRAEELARPGTGTVKAIRADVLTVAGVSQCEVFENVNDIADADGVPAHSFETVIWDGDTPAAANADVAASIYGNKPAGIKSYGTSVLTTYTDKYGNPVDIRFTRAAALTTYLIVDVTTNSDFDGTDGPTAIKNALVASGDALAMGDDVIALALRAIPLGVKGVVDVPSLKLGFAAAPTGTANLTVTNRQIARFDTSRITVNLV